MSSSYARAEVMQRQVYERHDTMADVIVRFTHPSIYLSIYLVLVFFCCDPPVDTIVADWER